jgi:hypothetical protein
MRREFGVKNSYTLEISFLGHQVEDTIAHFKIEDLEKMGSDFAVSMCQMHVLPDRCLAVVTFLYEWSWLLLFPTSENLLT